MIVVRIIFLIFILVFLFVLFVYIPYMFLSAAISSLIGRPLGFGWKRVEADIQPFVPDDGKEPYSQPIMPGLKVAVFELNGETHKTPFFSETDGEYRTLYVNKKRPREIWAPKYPDKLTAAIGALMLLAFWAGLVYAGIYIYHAATG